MPCAYHQPACYRYCALCPIMFEQINRIKARKNIAYLYFVEIK
jgi:hypothetical protein